MSRTVECPRCRAGGHIIEVTFPDEGGLVRCDVCGTTWNRGNLGQLIAVPDA